MLSYIREQMFRRLIAGIKAHISIREEMFSILKRG